MTGLDWIEVRQLAIFLFLLSSSFQFIIALCISLETSSVSPSTSSCPCLPSITATTTWTSSLQWVFGWPISSLDPRRNMKRSKCLPQAVTPERRQKRRQKKRWIVNNKEERERKEGKWAELRTGTFTWTCPVAQRWEEWRGSSYRWGNLTRELFSSFIPSLTLD